MTHSGGKRSANTCKIRCLQADIAAECNCKSADQETMTGLRRRLAAYRESCGQSIGNSRDLQMTWAAVVCRHGTAVLGGFRPGG